MQIFVTGATGEIGRPAVEALVRGGHGVRAATRGEDGDRIARGLGAQPVRADLFDGESVRAAVGDADAVLHLATKIPPSADMGDLSNWEENDRLRAETTRHLVAAAVAAGTRVLVLQSYFAVQPPAGDAWIEGVDDAAPRWSDIGVMDSMRAAEEALGGLAGSPCAGVVLRFGSIYSERSEQLQAQIAGLTSGEAAIPGDGRNYWPFVASADAGDAIVAALSLDGGTFNVADDDPVTLERFYTEAAAALGVEVPGHWEDVSGPMADVLLGSWRVSNRPFREATGWRPSVPSVLEGWPAAALRYLGGRPGRRPALMA
jgi:nucleoside-diphosphate-sugar epimerase